MSAPAELSPEQLYALFDILNHYETYRELESFKHSRTIREYGYPFALDSSQLNDPKYAPTSSTPLVSTLVSKVLLTVPGMAGFPAGFWHVNFQGVVMGLSDASLSESYDKGTLGTRKTLSTGFSTIHEAATRGILCGVPKRENVDLKSAKYDLKNAADLERAWNDFCHELVHGNLVDELFDHFANGADLESHSAAVEAVVEYAMLHIASLLHQVFVLSAEGQYLLKLIASVYKLIPFSMIRQTLKIGNAASMINGMMKLFLGKVGIGGLTNMVGLTKEAGDGMNLMQRMVSMVTSWDAADFRKEASKIKSAKDGPTKDQIGALRDHIDDSWETLQAFREISMRENKSMVAVIMESKDPSLVAKLSESQHTQCLEWFSAKLSARDRAEISRVLCKSNPDTFTATLKDAVSSYEPYIRRLHETTDLKEIITSAEKFLGEFIETSKAKGSNTPPSVEDYVALLRRNKHLLFNFAHDFAKNCTDIRDQFRQWAKLALVEFKLQDQSGAAGPAGAMSARMQGLYAGLSEGARPAIVASLDAHIAYLAKLDGISAGRMQGVLAGSGSSPSMSGPGVYLMRWSSLLDETLITPATASGPVRHGRDVKGLKAWGKTVAEGSKKGGWDAGALARQEESIVPQAPDVQIVMDVLGPQFRQAVNELNGDPVADVTRKLALLGSISA